MNRIENPLPLVDWGNPQNLRRFSGITREACVEGFDKDSCIAATRVGLDVLGHFGVAAAPLTVEAEVFNAIQIQLLRERGGPPKDWKEAGEWMRQGAWAHGIGTRESRGREGWPGHLVMIVGERQLVDLSIGQANKPEKGIVLGEPIVCEVTRPFMQERERLVLTKDGILLTYLARSRDLSYRQRPEWRSDQPLTRLVVERTIKRVINAFLHGR